MKKIIREYIHPSYSLHDMNVISFEIMNHNLVMKTQSGMIETFYPYSQADGFVEFHNVRWDFSYVYLLGVSGNIGTFKAEKMFLRDFISKNQPFGFSIMDETYGYHVTKYNGYLLLNRQHCECIIEIYHEGDMVFVVEA